MDNLTMLSPFDQIKRDDLAGEYWFGRDLMPLLGYPRWADFKDAIERAIAQCDLIGLNSEAHFLKFQFQPNLGRPGQDYQLTSLAVTLLIMSGDSRKPGIAAAQAYFVAKALGLGCQIGTWKDDDKAGFVYLIRHDDSNKYKIGKSKDPYRRLQRLQIGTPFELQVIHRIWSADAFALESALHDYYAAYQCRGEWFDLPAEIVREFPSVAYELNGETEAQLIEGSQL